MVMIHLGTESQRTESQRTEMFVLPSSPVLLAVLKILSGVEYASYGAVIFDVIVYGLFSRRLVGIPGFRY